MMDKLFMCIFLSCLLLVVQGQHSKSRQPNIIFILADDLGYGDVGVFYQNMRKAKQDRSEPWMSTPSLDNMAANGAMLTSHYCAAPVCAPSRASLLSGLSQGHANVRNNQFDKALADHHTLGTILRQAGYSTAAIGKWGLQGEGEGPDWPAHPLKRGFDYYYGYIRHKDGHEHYPKEGIYRSKAQVWENYTNVVEGLDKCYTGDLWTAAAKKWIMQQAAKAEQPFFLYLAYDNPHAALELPTQEYPGGGGLKDGMQWLGRPGQMISTASGIPDSWLDPSVRGATWDHDKDPTTAEVPWPDTYKRYATIVQRLDRQVGDLLQLLQDLKIADNTMVVFTSDNGPSQESYLPKNFVPNYPDFFNGFGPFDGIKRDVLEGGVREPTIVLWPEKISASLQLESPSAFNDWMPTLAEAAGVPVPAFCDGRSLLPLLTSSKEDKSRTVYIEYFEPNRTPAYNDFDVSHRNKLRGQMQMLRLGDTVALRYNIKNADDDFELYDVSTDPQQVDNLALHGSLKARQQFFKEAVLMRRRPDASAPRPYDSAYIASISRVPGATMQHSIRFFKGHIPWMKNVDGNENTVVTAHAGWASLKLSKADEGMVYVEGYFHAPADGKYIFSVNSGGTLLVKLHAANLFNNDERFPKEALDRSEVMLQQGFHSIRIYFYKEKSMSLKVPEITWIGPDSPKPVSLWKHL